MHKKRRTRLVKEYVFKGSSAQSRAELMRIQARTRFVKIGDETMLWQKILNLFG